MEAASPLRSGLYGGLLYGGLFVSFTLQLIAVAGIIVLSQYTFPDHNRMHMIGSYMLFIGHGAGIGIATGILVATRSAGAPRVMNGVRSEAGAAFRPPGSDPVRIALGTGVVVLSLFYLAVFLTKDAITFIDIYAVRLIYTWLELAVIIAFLLFLASLSPAVYDEMERRHASAEPR